MDGYKGDAEWEQRFVVFGYILLQALDKIARNKMNPDAEFAQKEREKFDSMVTKKGEHYLKIKNLGE